MNYNLLESHKRLAEWMVKEYRQGKLSEEFQIMFTAMGEAVSNDLEVPSTVAITRTGLDALAVENLITLVSAN